MKIIRTKVEKFPKLTQAIRKEATFPHPIYRCHECKVISEKPQMYCGECIKKADNLQNQIRFHQSL